MDYPGVDERLKEAGEKDNLAYYLKEAEEAVKPGPKENFDRALKLYLSALKYEGSESIRPLVVKTRISGAQSYLRRHRRPTKRADLSGISALFERPCPLQGSPA